mmetsp:Transcript_17909/g.53816  ORF Transcript_17909/g.53816 Transcript_17909/m.53816 type:complete len:323 (-) Transcript_17909:474-1442(-)
MRIDTTDRTVVVHLLVDHTATCVLEVALKVYHLGESARDVQGRRCEDGRVHLLSVGELRCRLGHAVRLVQVLLELAGGNVGIGHKVEDLTRREHRELEAFLEELGDVLQILAKEDQRIRVIVFHTLTHIDKVHFTLVPQEVVLREIAMNQTAILKENSGVEQTLMVGRDEFAVREVRILETRCSVAVVTNELHHEHMFAQKDRLRRGNACLANASQVAALLLGPQCYHLSRVVLIVSSSIPPFTGDVSLTILEDQDTGLVDLDGCLLHLELTTARTQISVVHIGLLTGAHATVDLVDVITIQQTKEDHTSAWVQDLLLCCTI